MKALLTFALLLVTTTGWAGPKNQPTDPQWEMAPAPDYAAVSAALKGKKNRAPASAEPSPAFKKFSAAFKAASKDRNKLHEFLLNIDDNFGKPIKLADGTTIEDGNDIRYFAAQIALLRPMRSIVYRLRPLMEKKGRMGMHSASVTAVRNAATAMSIFLPGGGLEGSEARGIFDYLVAPSINSKDVTFAGRAIDTNNQFSTVADVQNFLTHEYGQRLQNAIARITPIYNNPGSQPLVWDNEMVFPRAPFKDGSDDNPERYHVHGQAEVGVVLSAMHWTFHRAAMFCAYWAEELFDVAYEMGKKQGFDGWLGDPKFGISKEDKTQVLKSAKFANFLTLKKPVVVEGKTFDPGHHYMQKAWEGLENSIKINEQIWRDIVKTDRAAVNRARENVATVLNFVVLQTNEQAHDANFEALAALLKGNAKVFSTITGEHAEVNLPLIFRDPPADLKALLPKGFTKVANQEFQLGAKDAQGNLIKGSDGKPLWWRNYFGGQANTWDQNAWISPIEKKAYMSSPTGKVSDALRVFRTSWGGDMISGPLAFAVR